ncbi:hypothetical protein [Mesomycoplasma lagogenitalium]|uniref:Uncharacterized protein n=1 Tax=Mesomycoplasma lagogenitalium TaxID=171286 RepID=A0ABY8LWH6_9BACT|nr:hypothetical protein [Mesomycoplasma lagogenitalium]WGI36477.1 hypothetical protein QEG99_03360 [Mesomycoplasma lagogenitalium]
MNINKSKIENTPKWLIAFFTYITSPESERHKIYKNKSLIETESTYEPDLNYFENFRQGEKANFINLDYENAFLKFLEFKPTIATDEKELILLKEVIKNSNLKNSFANKHRLLKFYHFNYKNEVYYFIEVITNFLTNKEKRSFIFADTLNNEKLPEFIEVKLLRSGYLAAFTKIKQVNNSYKFYIMKFSDIMSNLSYNSDKFNVIFKKELVDSNEVKDPVNWFNNYKLIDINENYTNGNLLDVVVYLENQRIWYGQIDSDVINHQKAVWKYNQNIKYNQSPNDLKVDKVKNIKVSTMTKRINEKDVFYGNINVATQKGSQSTQGNKTYTFTSKNKGESYKWLTNGLKPLFINTKTNKFKRDKISEETSPGSKPYTKDTRTNDLPYQLFEEIGTAFSPLLKTNPAPVIDSYRFNLKVKLSFAISGHILKSDWQTLETSREEWYIYESQSDLWKNSPSPKIITVEKSFSVSFEQLKQFLNPNTNGNFKISVNNDTSPKIQIHLKNVLVGEIENNDLKRLMTWNIYSAEFSWDIFVQATFSEIERSTDTAFKIAIREEETGGSLIFERDKEVSEIQDSKKAIVLSNNEIYTPIKINGIWYLYLFDNSSNIGENNQIVKSQAVKVGLFDINTEEVDLISVREEPLSRPILLNVVNLNTIRFFYKQADSQNSKNWIDIKLSNGYHFNRDYLFAFKEHNIIKVLFFDNFNNYGFLNIKYDGKPYSLNNYPYLFTYFPEFNTIKEAYNLSTVESNKLIYNNQIKDIIQNKNTLTISSLIDNTTLNNYGDSKQAKKLSILDNNGNEVFDIDLNLNKSNLDNFQVNSHIKFTWNIYNENGEATEDQNKAIDYASLYLDSSNIDKFLRNQIKFDFTRNGKTITEYGNINQKAIRIEEKTLIIDIFFSLRPEPNVSKLINNVCIGNKQQNNWIKLPIELSLSGTETQGVGMFFAYTLEYEEE